MLTLACSGVIKDRLGDAFRNHLAHVNADDLPESLRAAFRTCHETLTRERPLRGEDAVRATVRKMSGEEADEVARGVVQMFGALALAHAQQQMTVQHEALAAGVPAEPRVAAAVVNGAHSDVLNGAIALNGALKGARKPPKGVPQIISLYAAEA
ncbi:MAG: hypothetical protein PVS2B3_00710 [Steroidobacteraceae bacterium]